MRTISTTLWKVWIPIAMLSIVTACGTARVRTLDGIQTHNATKLLVQKATDEVNHIHGVARSTVVIEGNDMVIGIEPRNGIYPSVLEQRVRRIVGDHPHRQNVYVTADPNIHQQIQTLSTLMTNHPPGALHPMVRDVIFDIRKTQHR